MGTECILVESSGVELVGLEVLLPSRHPRRLSCVPHAGKHGHCSQYWGLPLAQGCGPHGVSPAWSRTCGDPRHLRVHAQQGATQRGQNGDWRGRTQLVTAAPRLSPTAMLKGQRPEPLAISRPPRPPP